MTTFGAPHGFMISTGATLTTINRTRDMETFYLDRAASGCANDAVYSTRFDEMQSRQDLIDRFNLLAGPPSHAMALLQIEFVQQAMDAEDMLAFAELNVGFLLASARGVDQGI